MQLDEQSVNMWLRTGGAGQRRHQENWDWLDVLLRKWPRKISFYYECDKAAVTGHRVVHTPLEPNIPHSNQM